MTDRALIVAALIVGGAIVAASFQTRARYALSAADSNVAWRMDTWSGQIDICGAHSAERATDATGAATRRVARSTALRFHKADTSLKQWHARLWASKLGIDAHVMHKGIHGPAARRDRERT
jgi:hypothetical protein